MVKCSFVCLCLAAGAYDNKITLWDIGGIDSQYNFKARWVHQKTYSDCMRYPKGSIGVLKTILLDIGDYGAILLFFCYRT